MNFEEDDKLFLTLENTKKCFVYFLIKDKEVVYVGKSENGLRRPFEHRDKQYDTVKILYDGFYNLDEVEDKYIIKYRPIYNKTYNHFARVTLETARKMIADEHQIKKLRLRKVIDIMEKLEIEPIIFNGVRTISLNDLVKVEWEIANEIYNRGF